MKIRAIDKRTNKIVYIVQIIAIMQSGFVCAYIEHGGDKIEFGNVGYFKIDDNVYKNKEETVDGHNTSVPTDRNNQWTN